MTHNFLMPVLFIYSVTDYLLLCKEGITALSYKNVIKTEGVNYFWTSKNSFWGFSAESGINFWRISKLLIVNLYNI